MPSGELAQAPVERNVKAESQKAVPAPAQSPTLLAMSEKSAKKALDHRTLFAPSAPGVADDFENKSRLAVSDGLQQTDASKGLEMAADQAKEKVPEFADLKSGQAMVLPAAKAGLPQAAAPASDAELDKFTGGGSKVALVNDRQTEAKDMKPLSGAALDTAGARKNEPETGRIIAGSAAISMQANAASQNGAAPASQAFRSIGAQQQKLNVLNRFVVEQAGNTIRIHDADGTTYTGEIREPNGQVGGGGGASGGKTRVEFMSQPHDVAAKRAGADPADRPPANRFFFRVTGNSKSLTKVVVFEGTFLSTEPGVGVLQNAPSTLNTEVLSNRAAQNNLQSSQSPPNQTQTVRIVGRVTVEGGSAVEIEAVSVTNP